MLTVPFTPPPVCETERFRVEMTVSCRDCDELDRVADAGKVIEEHGERIQIMHNGVRVIEGGYYGAWMTEIIARLGGHHEPQEERVFHELLKHVRPDATMIELGGFWSYYSLWFLSQGQDRRSVVLEPDPRNIAVGRRNAELNGRTIDFVQGYAGPITREAVTHTTDTVRRLTLPQHTVAELMGRFGFPTLDILHCDIQGGETALIASCEDMLRAGTIRFGVFSTHAHQISGDPLTHQKCLHLIREFGGSVLAEHDVHEGFSGDGLIVAYFGKEPLDWPALKISHNRYATSLFRNPLYDLAEERAAGALGHVVKRLRGIARKLVKG